MGVKQSSLHMTILLITLFTIIASTQDHACNKELLNSFKLIGLDHPSNEKLTICKTVEENCCSLIDEVTIVKFWDEYSTPKINRFVNYLSNIY